MNVRIFVLKRGIDESGGSGTGIVAEGVEFSNGKCALTWRTRVRSVAVYDNIKELEAIHGHGGNTRILFVPNYNEAGVCADCQMFSVGVKTIKESDD